MPTAVLHKQISLPEVKVLIGEILKVLNEADVQLPEFETNYRICNNALSLMYNSLPDKSQNINRIFREVTIQIDGKKCNGCKKCISVCNWNVLFYQNKSLKITDSRNCIGCLRCMNVCKQRAIEITRYR